MNNSSSAGRKDRIWPFEWISLIVLFLVAGSIGHDPWKLHEPYVFGVIYHFFTTHSWLIPIDADKPFMEKPPLYHWTGAVFCSLFGSILPLHDAARLASAFYTAFTALFMWKSSQLLFAARSECKMLGWISIALLLGQIGVATDIHQLRTDVPLLTGTTIAIYGMALLGCMPQHWIKAGIWTGLGFSITLMSKGLFMPITLILSGILLWRVLPSLHNQNTWRALKVAFLVALPCVTIWPALVCLHSPALFMEWFWDNNVGRFLGFSVPRLGAANHRHDLAFSLLKNTFPALPLACMLFITEKREWHSMEYMLPISIIITGLFLLILSATGHACYILPLMPCFALLAAPVMLELSESFLSCWNLGIRILTSVAVAGIWLLWLYLRHASDIAIFQPLKHLINASFSLDLAAPEQTFACAAAIAMALLWLVSLRLTSRSALNTAYIWLAATGLLWVTMALFLPWQNEKISYRGTLMQMVQIVQQFPGEHNCVEISSYDELISPMFQYMAEPLLPKRKDGETCPFLFIATDSISSPVGPQWHLIWKGARPDKEDEMRLYQANDTASVVP